MVALTLAAGASRITPFGTGTGEIQSTGAHTYTTSLDSYLRDGDPTVIIAGPSNSSATWTLTVNGGIASESYGALLTNGFGAVSHRIVVGAEGSIFGDLSGILSLTRATITNAGVIEGGITGINFFDNPQPIQSSLTNLAPNLIAASNLQFSTTNNITITNAATGSIEGVNFGITNISVAAMSVTNGGEIIGGMAGRYSTDVEDGGEFQSAIFTYGRLTLVNQATGVIDGGVAMAWLNNSITNAGVIYGAVDVIIGENPYFETVNGVGFFDINSDGINAPSEAVGNLTGLNLINSGFIYGEEDYFPDTDPLAVWGGAARDSLTNTGTIYGFVDLAGGNDTLAGAGTYVGYVQMGFGNDTATIAGRITGFFRATGEGNGGGADNDVVTVTATGRIEQDVWMGGGNNSLTNAGTILGFYEYFEDEQTFVDYGDVAFGSGNDTMTNSGRIGELGDFNIMPRDLFPILMAQDPDVNVGMAVDMGAGSDRFTNTGTLLGYVEMGVGNDTFIGGAAVEFVLENDGLDSYTLGAGNDLFSFIDAFDTWADTIDGGAGRDMLVFIGSETGVQVDLGSSTVRNVNQTGTIDTVRGFEVVIGSDYRDYLIGGAGAETLVGGDGADDLRGRGGKDVLIGGDGADDFMFDFGSSGTTRATRDVIMDFEQGDRLYLLMDANTVTANNQAFNYAGIEFGTFDRVGGAFQAGQLRYVFEGGNTILRGDTNGDGRADFSIEIRGQFHLDSGDFVIL